MQYIRMMRQTHQSTAFDEPRALVGDDGLPLDQARIGQSVPVLLPGRGRAVLRQLDLQNRQRMRLYGHQHWLPTRQDFLAQQQDNLRVWPPRLGQGPRIRREPLCKRTDRSKRQSQLLEDLGNAFERAMSLKAE